MGSLREPVVRGNRPALAVRTVERHTVLGREADRRGSDRRPAAPARAAGPGVDVRSCPPGSCRRSSPGCRATRLVEQPACESDDGGEVGYVGHRRPWRDAAQEQRLGHVEGADAGEVALVEQRLSDRAFRRRAQPANRVVRVPVGPEQVRPEVPDNPAFVRGGDEVQHPQLVPDRRPVVVREDSPDVALATAPPALAGAVHVPGAVHAQVAVQGQAGSAVRRGRGGACRG